MVNANHLNRLPAVIAANASIYVGSCLAFTPELRRVAWPHKFCPELLKCYDGIDNRVEFLQLYTIGIQAAGGDDKVMGNWFPMALKEPVRAWIMNLPESSIPSWAELCDQFVANFKGTYGRPLTKHDLQAVRQRSGEMLHKYIQRFSQVRNEVPRVSEAEVISSFSAGVTDVRMCENLAIHDEISTVVKLFELADRCARAEEGCLFAHGNSNPGEPAEPAKAKSTTKCKPQAVHTIEPEGSRA